MPPPSSPPPYNYSSPPFSDQDFEEPGLTDLQTVALTSLLTLIPLFLGLALCYGFKYIWRSVRSWRKVEAKERSGSGGLRKSSAPVENNSTNYLLLPDEMRPSESQFSVLPVEEVDEALGSFSSSNQTSKTSTAAANGSIITMTMKNNHLIVETEQIEEAVVSNEKEEDCEKTEESVYVVQIEASREEKEEIEADSTALIHQTNDEHVIGPSLGLSQSDLSSISSANSQILGTYLVGGQREYVIEKVTTKVPFGPLASATTPSSREDSCSEEDRSSRRGSDRPGDLELTRQASISGPYDNAGYLQTPAAVS